MDDVSIPLRQLAASNYATDDKVLRAIMARLV
jgi:hypothetical protein